MYRRIYLISIIKSTVTIECFHISELVLKLYVVAGFTSFNADTSAYCYENTIYLLILCIRYQLVDILFSVNLFPDLLRFSYLQLSYRTIYFM
jgi:hypothetical protein